MQEYVDHYQKLTIQINTPYNVGTGFYLPHYGLIITNEHVVRDNYDVVIEGSEFPKQIVKVLFLDMRHDLAFLEAPKSERADWPDLNWLSLEKVEIGNEVIAISTPINPSPATAIGTISDADLQQDSVRYIQHTADLNPGNSGGPLMDREGRFIGLNTFVAQKKRNNGFTLPNHYILAAIEQFLTFKGQTVARCYHCSEMFSDEQMRSKPYCPACGNTLQLPSAVQPFEPLGCAKTIEQMLDTLGHNVKLARRGPNHWTINQGSARISILYYEKTGLIIGDASLCNLPPKNIQPLYEYLLRQNYETEGLTFSVKGQDVVLSLLIYDRYLNVDTGKQLFQHLFERADYYDNVLVEEYGASWK